MVIFWKFRARHLVNSMNLCRHVSGLEENFLDWTLLHVKLSNCNHNVCSVCPDSSESDINRCLPILTLSLLIYALRIYHSTVLVLGLHTRLNGFLMI